MKYPHIEQTLGALWTTFRVSTKLEKPKSSSYPAPREPKPFISNPGTENDTNLISGCHPFQQYGQNVKTRPQ